jgi:hypothetical protein
MVFKAVRWIGGNLIVEKCPEKVPAFYFGLRVTLAGTKSYVFQTGLK